MQSHNQGSRFKHHPSHHGVHPINFNWGWVWGFRLSPLLMNAICQGSNWFLMNIRKAWVCYMCLSHPSLHWFGSMACSRNPQAMTTNMLFHCICSIGRWTTYDWSPQSRPDGIPLNISIWFNLQDEFPRFARTAVIWCNLLRFSHGVLHLTKDQFVFSCDLQLEELSDCLPTSHWSCAPSGRWKVPKISESILFWDFSWVNLQIYQILYNLLVGLRLLRILRKEANCWDCRCDVCRNLTSKSPATAPALGFFRALDCTSPSPGLGLKSDENFAIVKETWLYPRFSWCTRNGPMIAHILSTMSRHDTCMTLWPTQWFNSILTPWGVACAGVLPLHRAALDRRRQLPNAGGVEAARHEVPNGKGSQKPWCQIGAMVFLYARSW